MEDGNSDPPEPNVTLFGYALARLLNRDDAKKVLSAVATINSVADLKQDQKGLLKLLRAEIRRHFATKYSTMECRSRAEREISEMLSVPFVSNVKISHVHTEMLDSVSSRDFWEASRECLGMLHSVQADVYVLREMEDVSCEDIAEMTGLSFEVVLELVYRGRMIFVKCLLKRLGINT